MSRMSINFDNEEQYNNFIQSIRDEILKEVKTNNPYQNNGYYEYLNEFREARRLEYISGDWNYIADRQEFYGMFKTALNCKYIYHLNHVDIEKVKSFGNELMELINKYRYEEIKEENK